MSLEDGCVVAASQAVKEVLRMNQTPALGLASLFDQYLYLLTDDTEALLLKFAQQAEPPAVEEYEEHLSNCRAAVETIRCCSHWIADSMSDQEQHAFLVSILRCRLLYANCAQQAKRSNLTAV